MGSATRKPNDLMSLLPKDRRNGADSLWIQESTVTADRVVFTKRTQDRVSRVLDEHRNHAKLTTHGYRPKTKSLFWGPPGTGKTLTGIPPRL